MVRIHLFNVLQQINFISYTYPSQDRSREHYLPVAGFLGIGMSTNDNSIAAELDIVSIHRLNLFEISPILVPNMPK